MQDWYIYGPKQGDNGHGSVHPSVCFSVRPLLFEDKYPQVSRKEYHITNPWTLSVSLIMHNLTEVVDWLLITNEVLNRHTDRCTHTYTEDW